jgi:uncharacterized protein (TIGR03382 family)
MKRHLPHIIAASLLIALGLFAPPPAQAQVLTLNFADGNGTTSVDQYTGTTGSGWNTAWTSAFGADTSTGTGTVINTTPLYTGGDNYLHVTYDTGSGSARTARISRQWNTSAISLAAPITLDFYFRSDTAINNSNQSFVIFGSSSATGSTSANDSWKITIDGGGISAFDNTTAVSLGTGSIAANTPFHFTLAIDPTANTYTVSATNLTTPTTYPSGTLALRNGADASLSYINIVANGGASLTGLGYSIDGLSVVPEPTTAALAVGGLAAAGLLRRRKLT